MGNLKSNDELIVTRVIPIKSGGGLLFNVVATPLNGDYEPVKFEKVSFYNRVLYKDSIISVGQLEEMKIQGSKNQDAFLINSLKEGKMTFTRLVTGSPLYTNIRSIALGMRELGVKYKDGNSCSMFAISSTNNETKVKIESKVGIVTCNVDDLDDLRKMNPKEGMGVIKGVKVATARLICQLNNLGYVPEKIVIEVSHDENCRPICVSLIGKEGA